MQFNIPIKKFEVSSITRANGWHHPFKFVPVLFECLQHPFVIFPMAVQTVFETILSGLNIRFQSVH